MESGRFTRTGNTEHHGQSREFTQSDFQELTNLSRGLRDLRGEDFASSAGSTSLERAILTQTFLRAKSSQVRREILDRFSLLGSQRLSHKKLNAHLNKTCHVEMTSDEFDCKDYMMLSIIRCLLIDSIVFPP